MPVDLTWVGKPFPYPMSYIVGVEKIRDFAVAMVRHEDADPDIRRLDRSDQEMVAVPQRPDARQDMAKWYSGELRSLRRSLSLF